MQYFDECPYCVRAGIYAPPEYDEETPSFSQKS